MMSLSKKLLTFALAAGLILSTVTVAHAAEIKIAGVSVEVTNTIEPGIYYDDLEGRNYIQVVSLRDDCYVSGAAYDVGAGQSGRVRVGDTVKATIELRAASGYRFSGSYSSSNIHIKGGTYVSRSVDGSSLYLTFKTKPIKGQFGEPEGVEWKSSGSSLGIARWTAPFSTSGYYDISLWRDGKKVYTQECYHGTSFNLYPWMTREGDYTFKVRTNANGNANGKNSEWVESESQYIDEKHKSDGSGQHSGGGTGAGWMHSGNLWYYIYPDGTMKKNGWEKINGKWYLFGSTGEMLTGWQTTGGQTYYLDPTNGDMKTGWIQSSDRKWYYLNPNPLMGVEGAMLRNSWLDSDGHRYYMDNNGAMSEGWVKVGDKFYYFNPNDGGPRGSMLRNTRIDTFYVGADGAWIQNY